MYDLEKVKCPACGEDDSKHFQTTKTMMAPQSESWNFDQCNQCKMVYLNPRVPVSHIGDYYRVDYLPYRGGAAWGKYSDLVDGDQVKVDLKRVETIKKYATKDVKSILDVGCGKPSFLSQVQRDLKIDCTGIDFSDHGWSSNESEYSNINLVVGEIEQIPKGKKYDIITMWQYMEHDYHPHETLTKLLHHSHKDTRIIIEVPCIDSTTRKKYGANWAGYHSPRHTGLFTPDTMTTLMNRSGWQVEDAYTYGTLDPYILDWMSRMEAQKINWTESMESRFTSFVTGKIMRPKYFFHKGNSQGFMTVIAQPS